MKKFEIIRESVRDTVQYIRESNEVVPFIRIFKVIGAMVCVDIVLILAIVAAGNVGYDVVHPMYLWGLGGSAPLRYLTYGLAWVGGISVVTLLLATMCAVNVYGMSFFDTLFDKIDAKKDSGATKSNLRIVVNNDKQEQGEQA